MSTADLSDFHTPDPGLRVGASAAVARPAANRPGVRRAASAIREVMVLDPVAAPLKGDERVVVCLPTYNEQENIERMLRALITALGGEAQVLVIDDGSPDGTADIAELVGAEIGSVEVMRRPGKGGLGRAYASGFAWALSHGAELIVQMDCDFSHDPVDVLRLVSASRSAGLVLGSRYVPGGRVVNWPPKRLMLSRGGSLYARKVLGLGVRDLTGGFKCWRRAALESIDLDGLRTGGYGFQIETTYRAAQQGCQIAEIPITFTERIAGVSKMAPGIALEAMREVPRMRLRT
jgi:dolichol-phosphate mannosyltransferase